MKTMMNCKEAGSASCGKSCCCFFCDQKDTCEDCCSDALEDGFDPKNCSQAYEPEEGLAVLQEKAAGLIQSISDLTIQKKHLDDMEKDMKKQLQVAMETYGVKKLENDQIRITYVAPTVRSTLDGKALKADLPDVAEKYTKTTPVSASVKITVK